MQKVAANDMPSTAICQHVAKELPAKSFEIDSNPQKVGSEQIGVKTARLQVVSRCERDLLRKRRSDGVSAPMTFQKKSRRERYIVRDDVVRVTGFEPAASCSQSRRATSCATPGYLAKDII